MGSAHQLVIGLASACVLVVLGWLQSSYVVELAPWVPWAMTVGLPAVLALAALGSKVVRTHGWWVGAGYAYLLTAYGAWWTSQHGIDGVSTLHMAGTLIVAGLIVSGLIVSVRVPGLVRMAVTLGGLALLALVPAWTAADVAGVPHMLYAGHLLVLLMALFVAGAARTSAMRTVTRSRDEVAEQRQLLRDVLDAIPSPIFLLDRKGRYQMTNWAGLDGMCADHPSEVVGKTAYDLYPPETARIVHRNDVQTMERGEDVVDAEYQFEMPDGEQRYVSATRIPQRDEAGHVTGLIGIVRDVTDKKEAEAELRQAKEAAEVREKKAAEHRHLLQTVVDTIPDFIYAMDREGRFVLRNKASLEPHGINDPLTILGKTEFDLFPQELAERYWADNQRVIETGEPQIAKEEPSHDGGVVATTKIPWRNEAGEIVGLIGISHDVTDKKAAEAAIREARDAAEAREREVEEKHRLLRAIVDTIPDYIYAVDREGTFTLRNLAATQSVGYDDPEAMVGLTEFDLFPREYAARYLASNLAVMEAGETLTLEEEVGHDGSWLLTTKVPLRDADGEVVGLVGTTRDITEQKKHEEELREAKEAAEQREHDLEGQQRLLRTVVDAIPDPIFMTDREGRFQLVNAVMRRAQGAGQGILGRTVFDFFPPELAERLFEEDQRLMRTGEALYGSEASIVLDDGAVRMLASTKVPLRDARGEVIGLVGTSRDITEQKEREEELREAKEAAEAAARAKSQILNNMSHELRTPLTSILGFAELLIDEGNSTEREFAEHIARSGHRLRTTLQSVLDLAQMESGGTTLDLCRLDVAPFVRETVASFQQQAQEKGLRLKVDVSPEPLHVQLDEGAMYRILSNLLSNALKFTDAGSVTVRVTAEGEEVCFAVEDTGIGIGKTFLPHLFEDFRQESSGLSRSHEGSGLGLAITKRLVELMDGTIGVASTKGEGTVFTVTLPWVKDEREAPCSGSRANPSAPLAGARILVVEDNHDTQLLIRRMLADVGVVEVASTCAEAVAAIAESIQADQPFDVFLVDINLGGRTVEGEPARDGLYVLRRLRQERCYTATPAVAMTAYAMPGDEERFLAKGFDRYLAKPFTKDALLRCIGVEERVPHLRIVSR